VGPQGTAAPAASRSAAGGRCSCLSALAFGFLWAITLLTYLLPPARSGATCCSGTLTPNQARFLAIGSGLHAEFAFARHLFCRFGCAVGLFQSLAWMANPKGMVMAFDRDRARDCRSCSTDLPAGARLRPRLPDAPERRATSSA
jgi:hypothetical protein